jgi:hypothetical protein
MRRERATRDYHKIIIISGNRAASMALHVSCNEMYTIPLQRKKKNTRDRSVRRVVPPFFYALLLPSCLPQQREDPPHPTPGSDTSDMHRHTHARIRGLFRKEKCTPRRPNRTAVSATHLRV